MIFKCKLNVIVNYYPSLFIQELLVFIHGINLQEELQEMKLGQQSRLLNYCILKR